MPPLEGVGFVSAILALYGRRRHGITIGLGPSGCGVAQMLLTTIEQRLRQALIASAEDRSKALAVDR
jgi:hypothetical protein